jgi:hypothetical protein
VLTTLFSAATGSPAGSARGPLRGVLKPSPQMPALRRCESVGGDTESETSDIEELTQPSSGTVPGPRASAAMADTDDGPAHPRSPKVWTLSFMHVDDYLPKHLVFFCSWTALPSLI